jgi:hypothetical protein
VANDKKQYSRRDFACKAALFSAAAPLAGVPIPTSNETLFQSDGQQPKLPPDFPKLSDQSHAEVEERYNAILAQYGGRFSEAQKADLKRLCYVAQPPLDMLRKYTVQNGDSPALYLKPIVDRDKKPTKASPVAATSVTKKPEDKQ